MLTLVTEYTNYPQKWDERGQKCLVNRKQTVKYPEISLISPKNIVRRLDTKPLCWVPLHKQVNGKKFLCENCGYFDHRDTNAAHNIRSRYNGDQTGMQRLVPVGLIGDPHKDRSLV